MWKRVISLLRPRTKEDQLLKEYDELIQRAHSVSHHDRRASDALRAQAEAIWEEIEILRFNAQFENDNS
jgi:hypothetical protein